MTLINRYRLIKKDYCLINKINLKGGVRDQRLFDDSIKNDDPESDLVCPDDKPYLCTMDTKSFGLCKEKKEDCNDIDIIGVAPEIRTDKDETKAEKFGYTTGNLASRCTDIIEVYNYNETNLQEKALKEISICTYNIMGIFRLKQNEEENDFMKNTVMMRMNKIAMILKSKQPDVVCFQEMSKTAFEFLYNQVKDVYPYIYEKNFCDNFDKVILQDRKKDIEVYMFSKYPVDNVKVYTVQGNLHYTNSLMIAEFKQFVVFNCYLQAGSKNSPGQDKYWYHYSRCRQDEMREIMKLIETYKKPVIIVGDFNCHLDGPLKDWNELSELKLKTFSNDDYTLVDSWKELYPNQNGFTENTDVNTMRWNMKFQEKKLRYDAILYTENGLKPIESYIIGDQPIELNDKDTELFRKYIMKDPDVKNEKTKFNADGKTLALFPSDHFGLVTKFSF